MKNTDYFNPDYEDKAIKALLEDRELIGKVYAILDQNYFSDSSIRAIVAVIKEYYKETGRTPDYTTLMVKCQDKAKGVSYGDMSTRIIGIKSASSIGQEAIEEHLIKFFTLKELVKMSKQIEEGLKSNDSTDNIIKKTMKQIDKISSIGICQDIETSMTDENIKKSLTSGDNETITTGIPELDEAMAGGLGREEIGLFVAPTGYGKTTMATILSQNAALAGYKVLQIYFEDKPDDIIRKHYAKLSGVMCGLLKGVEEDRIESIMSHINSNFGDSLAKLKDNLRMVRMKDGETTVEDIEEQIRRHINDDFRPDMITIDYFSSLKHSTNTYKKAFDAQASCMKKIKNLANKYNLAVWVMQQTNRTAVSKDADTSSMGNIQGSFEATQPVSVWLTLSRTNEQKMKGRADIIFNKTRHSQPKMNLENIVFDNGLLIVKMDDESGQADEVIDQMYQLNIAEQVKKEYDNEQH